MDWEAENRRLRAELAETKRANDILKKASASGNRPEDVFVADFLINSVLMACRIKLDHVYLFNGAGETSLTHLQKVDDPRGPQMLIRPTWLRITDTSDTADAEARVDSVEYAGGELLAVIVVSGQKLSIITTEMLSPGDQAWSFLFVSVDRRVWLHPY